MFSIWHCCWHTEQTWTILWRSEAAKYAQNDTFLHIWKDGGWQSAQICPLISALVISQAKKQWQIEDALLVKTCHFHGKVFASSCLSRRILRQSWFKCKLDPQVDLFFTKSLKDSDSFSPKENMSHTCANTIFNQEKVYNAPDLQNMLQKPVVWGTHFIIEGFLFCNGITTLLPFYLQQASLATHQCCGISKSDTSQDISVETLCFWPVAPVALGLDPAYPHTNLHWYILPLSVENTFLIKISLWNLTDYPNFYRDCNFPMSCEILSNPCYWIYCVIAGLLLFPHCQVMIRGMTVWALKMSKPIYRDTRADYSSFTNH